MIEQFVHTIEELNSINKRNGTMVAERHERFLNAMQPHVFGNVFRRYKRAPSHETKAGQNTAGASGTTKS